MTSKVKEKPSDRRAGKRGDRNKRVGTRIPELGYYLIVTDTEETEKNYFEGLRDSIPAELRDHLVIKVEKARTAERKMKLMLDGLIHVLKSGCMLILVKCLQLGNLIHAVIGLRRNLRRWQDRNILRKIGTFIESW